MGIARALRDAAGLAFVAAPKPGPGGDDDLAGAIGGQDAVQGARLGVVEHDDPPVGGVLQPVPQRHRGIQGDWPDS
jgi:hypothetical protein